MGNGIRNTAIAVLMATCAGCGYTEKQKMEMLALARENGAVIVYHGLGSGDHVTGSKKIAKDLEITAVEGSDSFALEVIKAAQDSEYGANLLYHSWGSEYALKLANECAKRGLRFRTSNGVDPYFDISLPENAGVVRSFISSEFYAPGKIASRGGTRTEYNGVPDSNHFNVCEKARWKIEEGIRQSRKDRSTNK